MVPGSTLSEIAARILGDAATKKDLVVPAAQILMQDHNVMSIKALSTPSNPVQDTFHMTDHAQGQMMDYLGIPSRFVDRLRKEDPELITIAANRLLTNEVRAKDRRMVRILPRLGVRGFLSDAYRRLDHEDVAERVFPIIQDRGFTVRSAQITDSRLYVQVVSDKLEGEVKVGHPVRMGFTLSNSEIGLGGLNVDPFVEVLRCTNGMIVPEFSKRTAHRGGRQGFDVDYSILKNETREAADRALWLSVRDHIDNLTSADGMERILKKMREQAGAPVSGDPEGVVEVLANKYALRDDERKSILYSFLSEGDSTRWGLCNAITQTANSMGDYDRAVEIERIGGKLLFSTGREWTSIADAAPMSA